jgi:hypothetical protein
MEGINVHHLIHDFRGKVDFLKPHPSLLEQLQSIHDAERHWMRSANMRNALQGVASAFNLDGTFLAGLSFADR